jgi:hypothetical protein
MKKRKWERRRTVTLPPCLTYGTDEWIFERYAITLLINRHVAEFQTDDDVSDALQKVRSRIPLPYGFDH